VWQNLLHLPPICLYAARKKASHVNLYPHRYGHLGVFSPSHPDNITLLKSVARCVCVCVCEEGGYVGECPCVGVSEYACGTVRVCV